VTKTTSVPKIDIRPDHWEIVRDILKKHVPQYEVWAFGSRAKWTAKEYSDLDLAIITDKPLSLDVSASLSDDFFESDLPWKVDIVDWAATSESFRKVIERDKVVVQEVKPKRSMTTEWPQVRLGDYCLKVGSGATPKGGKSVYLESSDIALIRSQNVYNDGFNPGGLAYITEEAAEKLRNVKVYPNDILLNITGDSVARVCLAPENYLPARVNQHVAIIRPDPREFDARFLRYFLASSAQQELLLIIASAGATRNALTKLHLESLEVRKPTLHTQKCIADHLEMLEKKIQLNQHINQTLEAIAQAIFKSWFVDFDPVKAKIAAIEQGQDPLRAAMRVISGKTDFELDQMPREHHDQLVATATLFPDEMEESALGEIPKGWDVKRIGDMIELAYGKALKSTDRQEGSVPVYGSGGITGYHNEALVPHGAIIVGRKGTVGSLYWEDEPFFPIDTTFYVKPKVVPMTYCFYAMQTLELEKMNTDAAVPGLNRENVYRLELVKSSASVLNAFDGLVGQIRRAMRSNETASQSLAALRDTLLPKLLSGEVRFTSTNQSLGGTV